jgi:hypothetical protein
VWIGQVSRDIGVRFTPRTWNLTTHLIDPDVDEARDYVLDGLRVAGRVARLGFVPGVQAAPPLTRAATSRAIRTLPTACERSPCSPPRGRPPRSCPGRLQQLRSEAGLTLTLGLMCSAPGSEPVREAVEARDSRVMTRLRLEIPVLSRGVWGPPQRVPEHACELEPGKAEEFVIRAHQ